MTNNPFADELADQEFNSEQDLQVGEVELDGVLVPIVGNVTITNLALWEPRFVIGDPKNDSDKYYSLWSQNDWTGGGQVEVLNVNSDVQRYRHGTLDAQWPDQLTLPLETLTYSPQTDDGDCCVIGNYAPSSTILVYGASGAKLHHYDALTDAWVYDADLTADPAGARVGIVYDDLLFIPMGSSGYDTWNGTVVTNHTDINVVAFVEWDHRLVALGTNGQIGLWDGTSWDLPADMRLRGNRTMRNLVVWWTPERKPAVFIVTSRDVWACDFIQEVVYRTGLQFPVHPDFGLGSCAWQDDAMYVSVGIGVHQLALGGVVDAMGPDRTAGVPSYLRGAITCLTPEYNGMLALIRGIGNTSVASAAAAGLTLEESLVRDAAPIVPASSTSARSALFRWTGVGWHCLWESSGTSGTPTNVFVSEADEDYRMWWGYGNKWYTQALRRTFYNPKQGAELGVDRFASYGYLYSGKFNAGMVMFQKGLSHLQAYLDRMSHGTLQISYCTDLTDPDFVLLGSTSDPGLSNFPFDLDGDGWDEGLAVRWIEFLYEMSSDDPTQTPVANWFALKFIKLPLQTLSFSFQVPLVFPEGWTGRSADDIRDHLDSLATVTDGVPIFCSFKFNNRTYRVRLARTSGEDETGHLPAGVRQVNLIELVTDR